MRWHDFSGWEKAAIVLLGLWFTVGWFFALQFPNPTKVWAAPFVIMFAGGAVIWIVLTFMAWVLRRLGR